MVFTTKKCSCEVKQTHLAYLLKFLRRVTAIALSTMT